MRAFLDCEFTGLGAWPLLLSVGLVTDDEGREFYAEVTDPDRVGATGWFGQGAVLPQFGKVAGAACRYAELGTRLSGYFDRLAAALPCGESIELDFCHRFDWELVELAITDSGSSSWPTTRRHIEPVNVYELTGYGPGQLAAEAYFEAQSIARYSRHHALCDARALRVAYDAATRPTLRSPQPMPAATVNRQSAAA